jgi:hypothetical protein
MKALSSQKIYPTLSRGLWTIQPWPVEKGTGRDTCVRGVVHTVALDEQES